MPVSGLVVSLAHEPELRDRAVEAVRNDPRFDVGVLRSSRMAVVCDTSSSEEDKQAWHWLQELPGVMFVDLAMVAFEDEHPAPETNLLDSTPQRV